MSTLRTDLPSLRKTDENLPSFVQAHALLKLKKSGFQPIFKHIKSLF